STLVTTVPTGTVTTMSSPPLPYICRPRPSSPRCALKMRWWRKSTRVFRLSSATSHTLPPAPPSPPSGPPLGMNFSWRNPTHPLPPLPAMTWISASSTSFMAGMVSGRRLSFPRTRESRAAWMDSRVRGNDGSEAGNKKPRQRRGFEHRPGTRALFGDDVHRAALLRALGGELHLAIDQREQRVVAAQADAVTRVELGATLADDDVAGLDGLAAVDLHAQVLRVGVAAVAGRTAC